MDTRLNIVVIEDNDDLREATVDALRGRGYRVLGLECAEALPEESSWQRIDILVVDLNLPGEDGLTLAARVRALQPDIGIIMVTARGLPTDKLVGYETGADIYMTKPVAPDELVLVLKSLGRRLHPPAHTSQEWVMNLRDRTLQGPESEQKLRLTHREKALLVALVQAKENTLDSGMLCDLFDNGDTEETMTKHALEELVARLRKKFRAVQPEGAEPALKSVWGVGYQLCVPITFA